MIDHDDDGTEPTVRVGPGWRQTTPNAKNQPRFYEDTAPGDDRWEATDQRFISVTEALRAGFPTDFTGPTKWNQARWTWANRADLLTKTEDDMVRAMVDSSEVTLRQAADRGTAVHHYIEDRLNGKIPNWAEVVEAGAAPWIAAVEQFLRDCKPQVVLAEVVCFDREHEVAGTCDAVVTLDPIEKHADLAGTWELDWKGLPLDTPIPTPTGWTTMGELKVGDEVFGSDGLACRVVGKSEIHNNPCYRIDFDDKTSIICDDDHLWNVVQHFGGAIKTLATTDLLATLRTGKGVSRWRIMNTEALHLPPADLPLDPYVLGAWLGDGTARDGSITKPDPRLWAEFERRGFKHAWRPGDPNRTATVYGILPTLRELGVLNNKHVPTAYLRGSIAQRLDLLRGLLDTDGHWNPLRGQAVFFNTNEALADAVYELVVSLGWRANKWTQIAHGFGVDAREWRVSFTPYGWVPFAARRGDVGDLPTRTMSTRRCIQQIERVETVPTQCIAVDSYDSTYLCGRQMVPTHNSRTAGKA